MSGSTVATTDVTTVDVVVLGMGGEAVAGDLAEAGRSVLGIDRKLVGGECPYWGYPLQDDDPCRRPPRRGPPSSMEWPAPPTVVPDWEPVARRIRDEATDDWDDRVAVERFEGKGGTFVRGTGHSSRQTPSPSATTLHRPPGHRAGHRHRARHPADPRTRRRAVLDEPRNVEAKELPASLLVLGGGAIGAELAQALARFGVTVTVIEAPDRLLPFEEPEAGDLLARSSAMRASTSLSAASRTGRTTARSAAPRRRPRGRAEHLLVATGRRSTWPNRRRRSASTSPPPGRASRRPPSGQRRGVGRRRPHRPRGVHPRRHVPGAIATADILGDPTRPPTTRFRGSPSPTPRSAPSA